MVTITSVRPCGYADRAGVRANDLLVSINGNEIGDVLDYRFYLTEREVTLALIRDGSALRITIRKGEYDDIGLDFETPLMDKKHSCQNGCVFCFIDQLPEGMRQSLYFKDDDDRLSFLHGNYVTLTNLKQADIDRLIKMHISPVNVSVHTTNPDLRVKMMKNKRAGEVLSYLGQLADAGIALCTQIVLCKGLNDKEELDRSMRDLLAYYPSLRSCAIVPVGLTKHRHGLYPLEAFTPEECAEVIAQVTAFGDACYEKYGTRLFYCADEFYIRAGLPLPDEDYYEEYSQIENGVGMITSLRSEFYTELDFLDEHLPNAKLPRTVSIATGAAAYDTIKELAEALESRVEGLTVHTYRIRNDFFGESVTVAGLLTGTDVAGQLCNAELGEELLLPKVMLKADEEIYLDDLTPKELSQRLSDTPIRHVRGDGVELLLALLGANE